MTTTTEEEDAPPPSLDELLGIEQDQGGEGAIDAAERQSREELQRRLNEQAASDAFRIALEKMSLSATLLDERFDAGLGTQRVQEEIIARLEQLIDTARQRQQQQGASSGASSRQSPSEAPPSARRGPNQRSANQPPGSGTPEGAERDPPPRQDGQVNAVLEEARSEWGNLPQREREMLLQGRREKFSSLYEQLTREYYRRLAEEGSP